MFTQPWPAGPTDKRRDQVIYYKYRADRARRTLRGIDEQVAKAEKAVVGKTTVKRNRFVQLTGGTRTVNRALEAKARAVAGLKGYVTNLATCPDGTPVTPEFVIDAYHRLIHIEKSFRMSKLRHAFATVARELGVPLEDVQDAMGHADARTTRRYDRARHALHRDPSLRLGAEYAAQPDHPVAHIAAELVAEDLS